MNGNKSLMGSHRRRNGSAKVGSLNLVRNVFDVLTVNSYDPERAITNARVDNACCCLHSHACTRVNSSMYIM